MRQLVVIVFTLLSFSVFAQDADSVVFLDPVEVDTSNIEAEPVGGYDKLMKFLAETISEGDTVGDKFLIPLYAVRFRVNKRGHVDSAWVSIPHAACPIHYRVAKELLRTRWIPARENGKDVESWLFLDRKPIAVTRAVEKKYKCKWRPKRAAH
jgi:hypothetical protein